MAGVVVASVVGGLIGYQIGRTDPAGSDPASASDVSADVANNPAGASDAQQGTLHPEAGEVRPATDAEREALRADGRAAGITDLTGIEQLRSLFDQDTGTTRVIALLSPTCITCLLGANWLQEELAAHPNADVRVFAIWFSVLPSDERVEWDDRILTDPRVTHLWDEDQLAGRWFSQRGYGDLPVQWDAAFIYTPDAQWGGAEEPSDLVIWGRTIIGRNDAFARHLQPLLDGS